MTVAPCVRRFIDTNGIVPWVLHGTSLNYYYFHGLKFSTSTGGFPRSMTRTTPNREYLCGRQGDLHIEAAATRSKCTRTHEIVTVLNDL